MYQKVKATYNLERREYHKMVTKLLRGGEARTGDGTWSNPSGEEAAPLEEVFEDKEAVHVKTVCA